MTKRTPFEAALSSRSVDRFAPLIGPDRMLELGAALEEMRELLDGRVFWDVNSTATGGGVAEMIRGLVPYLTGAGIAARWLVIEADPQFFLITKRLHHALHGSEGDGSVLGSEQRRHYEEILAANAAEMSALIRPGDPVMVHDPQTAGCRVRPKPAAHTSAARRCPRAPGAAAMQGRTRCSPATP